MKEQLTSKSSYKEEEPDYLNELLRRKISSYVNFRPMAKSPRKTNKKPFESKKNPLGIYTQKNFP